jgi:hypothetical protein
MAILQQKFTASPVTLAAGSSYKNTNKTSMNATYAHYALCPLVF